MKKLKLLLTMTLIGISTAGFACSGTWHTCDNLASFLVQVAENCPDSGSMTIIDCDAGAMQLEYAIC
jgi:hypothetical protein